MKQQRRHCSAEEKAKSSLEAVRCQQRSTLKKRNVLLDIGVSLRDIAERFKLEVKTVERLIRAYRTSWSRY